MKNIADMTTTPTTSRFKLSCKSKIDRKKEIDVPNLHSAYSSPLNNKNSAVDTDVEYSPIFFPLTQESGEEIDVLWDWHSPQTSQRRRKKQKRPLPIQSPKFPIIHYPLNNQNQNFDRLRDELKALQEELAQPDDEESLILSPQQEQEFKTGNGNNILSQEPDHADHWGGDLFNDSMDEQLVLFSQQIEQDERKSTQGGEEKTKDRRNLCDSMETENLINKYCDKKVETKENMLNDSFDLVLNSLSVETPKHSKRTFQRTVSDGHFYKRDNVIQTVSGKLEFHRTKSFELASLNGQDNSTQCTLEEIERKRLEAKARLESKKRKGLTQSPTKCSPEEIEKKRLQALAKLEAKKIQDIVEKKRQEALRKLQHRMKNASQVKGTLSKRL